MVQERMVNKPQGRWKGAEVFYRILCKQSAYSVDHGWLLSGLILSVEAAT